VGFILLGVLVLVSIGLVIRGWRNYEAELRKTPSSGDSTYPFAAVGNAVQSPKPPSAIQPTTAISAARTRIMAGAIRAGTASMAGGTTNPLIPQPPAEFRAFAKTRARAPAPHNELVVVFQA
jgi:hypothetical protein